MDDTLHLRIGLVLWLLLGCISAMRFRANKAVPASLTLIFAFLGSSISIVTMVQQLIATLMRKFGKGPPKLRCYRCLTIFETASGVSQMACPQCGTVNQVIAQPKGAFA